MTWGHGDKGEIQKYTDATHQVEGTRGQVGTWARGDAKIHGLHAVPPLPIK